MKSIDTIAIAMALLAALLCLPMSASATITGSISTADGSIIGGDMWAPPPAGSGYMLTWEISPNFDLTWHYKYVMATETGANLVPLASHIIMQLSENIEPEDLSNIAGDVTSWEFNTFGEHVSNPGFPTGKSIFGIKFNMGAAQTVVEFDANRKPMWGDFYSKGGKESYVYNADLGVLVANADDYLGIPVDGNGNALAKILSPDTVIVPEPGALTAWGLGLLGVLGARLRRR